MATLEDAAAALVVHIHAVQDRLERAGLDLWDAQERVMSSADASARDADALAALVEAEIAVVDGLGHEGETAVAQAVAALAAARQATDQRVEDARPRSPSERRPSSE